MFGCFFGHDWKTVFSKEMVVTHSILAGWRQHDEDAVYCDECYASIDASMAKDGFVPADKQTGKSP